MKDSAASPRKNPASLFITIGVVLVHIVVIGLIVSSCNSKSGEGGSQKNETEQVKSANGENIPEKTDPVPGENDLVPGKNAPVSKVADGKKNKPKNVTRWCDRDPNRGKAPKRLRVPSSKPNFGKPLTDDDVKSADHRPYTKFLNKKNWSGTGIVVDMNSRKVLWEKNSRKPVPVASMTKMMTILLVIEEIERNPKFSLDTEVTITESALNAIHPKERTSKKYKSKVPKPGDVYTVRQLLLCAAVFSSNEAATQLAEVVGGGSVDAFVARMNKRAKELGLNSMTFYTPSGLNHWRGEEKLISQASAADLVILAERLMEYPEVFKMFSVNEAMINGKTLTTTNHLVRLNKEKRRRCAGADGVKTGKINDAGFCLTFSVLRNGRRVIGCVTRFSKSDDRDNFCLNLIEWAYSQLK